MEDNRRLKLNPLSKKIDQGIRRTGYDENFIRAVKFHLKVISESNCDGFISRGDFYNVLMSKLFLNKMELYPTKRFSCQFYESLGWPVVLYPSEVFGENKLPDDYRRKSFYECLQVGDVLDCRVASVLPTEYHLRVIHKFCITRVLDDLNITVVMHRNKSELELLRNDVLTCELIRVAVSEIIKDEKKITVYVTVDVNRVEFRKCRSPLGRIREENLPSYVLNPPDPDSFSSYSDYLNTLSSFQNPIVLNGILKGFGIDTEMAYSFYPNYDRLKCPDELTGQILLKESRANDIAMYTNLAVKQLENGNASEALTSIEVAIKMNPQLCKLYEIRGKIHAEAEKRFINRKTLSDFGLALKLDPGNECVKKQLSKALFQAANKFYRVSQYERAARGAEDAYDLDSSNVQAFSLLEHLKEKHPEVFLNLDQESLTALQEKKKKLVSQLEKFR